MLKHEISKLLMKKMCDVHAYFNIFIGTISNTLFKYFLFGFNFVVELSSKIV